MSIETVIYTIAVWAIPVLFAITLHEVAHGWTANLLGDSTAKMLGRLSLNPIKHIDPVGTILVPAVLVGMAALAGVSPFVFGWAKPVPVNTRNLKNYRRDMAIVAIAGPAANILMAIIWAALLSLIYHLFPMGGAVNGFLEMAMAGIVVNALLAVLNIMPIPPLDGGRVLAGLTPPSISNVLDRIEPYGFFILIGLLYFGVLEPIMTPMIVGIRDVLLAIFI